MNIILFGPPGVGKSTLIGILKSKHFRAIDLEDIHPNSIRFQMPSMLKDVIMGGADLNPARTYPNTYKIFLSADQSAYESRRAARDKAQAYKAQQKAHQMKDWLKGAHYDLILDTTGQSPETTAAKIARKYEILKNGGLLNEGKTSK